MVSLPMNLSRARAYPTMELNTSTHAVDTVETKIELSKALVIGICVKTARYPLSEKFSDYKFKLPISFSGFS